MDSVVKVFGGVSAVMDWPGVAYSGRFERRAVQYNGLWYCEFLLLGSGTLTADKPYTVDVYLVGGGGKGASASEDAYVWYRARPGGGSGYQSFALDQTLGEGAHAVVIGVTGQASSIVLDSDVTISAAPGGNAIAGSSTPHAGTGFTGEYWLYGDEGYPCGTGGGATAPTDSALSTPGRGGGGCEALPFVKPGASAYWRLAAGSGRVDLSPIEASYGGFGAGAMGGLPVRSFGESSSAIGFSPEAAPGVCMVRIRMG
ncbi:MAG: hypothetical protein LBH66_05200 [Oscillospiraceae bacterium]|jgi:hypothetical protein|nr:hypothetical protein [Oscillospiraceae bacterium]